MVKREITFTLNSRKLFDYDPSLLIIIQSVSNSFNNSINDNVKFQILRQINFSIF